MDQSLIQLGKPPALPMDSRKFNLCIGRKDFNAMGKFTSEPALMLNTIRWASEIRSAKELKLPG